ncbi:MAG TPA: hypothetical protein VFG69_10665 [Nannocystaceae bacterium]|nr:hypothetical protein [Nannocystaceae bacterium]
MTISNRLAPSCLLVVLAAVGCKADEMEYRNGFIKLDFARGQSQKTSPFTTTTQITAVLNYRDCLQEYYSNNMNERQDGVDGAKVFGTEEDGGEGWLDHLCAIDLPQGADCSVESLTQQLDVGTPKLTIVYNVTGAIEMRQLAAGPFPDRDEAGCMAGKLPEVGLGSVKGSNSNGDVWVTETFDPTTAVVDQGGAITIYAKPSGS